MTNDRPLFGIALMIGFCLLIPFGDAIAKLLGSQFPVIELLLVRFAFQVVLLLPLIYFGGYSLRAPAWVMRRVALRAGLLILGMGGMFTSLQFLPLADTVAIVFVMPLFTLLLGKYVLKEEVGVFRLTVCCVGFAGTLLIVQPSFAAVGLPALLPLAVALVYALFLLVTRQISRDIEVLPLQVLTAGMAGAAVIVVLVLGHDIGIAELELVWPDYASAWLFVVIGIIGTTAHFLMTLSLKFAPSTTLAPLQYIEMPVATALGWLFFSELPNGLAAVGIFITVVAGLAIILRERQRAKGLTAP